MMEAQIFIFLSAFPGYSAEGYLKILIWEILT